jgi:hypothetical protein
MKCPPVSAGQPVAAILFWLIAWRNCLLSAIRMMTSGAGRQHTDLGQHPGLHLLTVACPCGVVVERWVTPEEADADLLRLARLN